MAITTEQLTDLNLLVKVQVTPDQYKPEVDKSIKSYARKVTIKGFRPGNVPAGIVKKMFGASLLAEELNKLVNKSIQDYIQDNKLSILGDPLPQTDMNQDIDLSGDTTYEFTFELGLAPNVSLALLDSKPTLPKHVITVDDTLLQQEIEHMQSRYGKVSNPETMKDDKDVFLVSLAELDEDGNLKEGGWKNEPAIPFEDFTGDTITKQLRQAKAGDSFDVILADVLNKDAEEIHHKILDIPNHDIHPGSAWRMTIKGINHSEPAEINQELFDKVYGEGNVEGEEAFREKVREELGVLLNNYTTQKLHNDIQRYLIENMAIQLPEDFLKRWLQYSSEKDVSEEDMLQELPTFFTNLKWTLISNRVMEDADIQVNREELEQHIRDIIRMEYGFTDNDEMGAHYLNELTKHFMGNKEYVEKTFEQIRNRKVFVALEEKFTLEDKMVTFDQFKELNK